MPTFLLIDHSLRGSGSHHFEYDRQLLLTAQESGYEIALATHRDFQDQDLMPSSWRVLPQFPHTTYSKFSAMKPTRQARKPVRGWWSTPDPRNSSDRLSQTWNRYLQRVRLRSFAQACHEVWQKAPLHPGDLVFIPTLSDHDLVGLVHFLARQEETRVVDWHLQFHFKFLEGRPPEYASQQAISRKLAQHFRSTLAPLRHHKLRFYSTTEELTEQFNRLKVGEFRYLPYLADPAPRGSRHPTTPGRPLRITCPGNVRGEKGQDGIAPILAELWESHFAGRRAQLLVQSGENTASLLPDRADPNLETALDRVQDSAAAIIHLPHPLDPKNYKKLIRHSDIGLFLYDSRAYYGRAAGILVEILMCGVPVIVPAGSWLGEQIWEPNQIYLEKLRASRDPLSSIVGPELQWTDLDPVASASTCEPNTLSVGNRGSVTRLDIPPGATGLWSQCGLSTENPRGAYVRAELRQFDRNGNEVAKSAELLGPRPSARPIATFQRLDDQAAHVEFLLRCAHGVHPMRICDTQIQFLDIPNTANPGHPGGTVGLAAADLEQVPRLLRDVIDHYPHYRAGAEAFAVGWRKLHSPLNTFSILRGRDSQATQYISDHEKT